MQLLFFSWCAARAFFSSSKLMEVLCFFDRLMHVSCSIDARAFFWKADARAFSLTLWQVDARALLSPVISFSVFLFWFFFCLWKKSSWRRTLFERVKKFSCQAPNWTSVYQSSCLSSPWVFKIYWVTNKFFGVIPALILVNPEQGGIIPQFLCRL